MPSLRALVLYFLRLGALGFGGPIALTARMQRDLVEQRRWVGPQAYVEGLALAQLAPGPLAAQLAIYLGWRQAGVMGATLVGLAFVLPSLAIVLALAALYVRFGGLPWMQAAFYGIGAAVIAVIARGARNLARMTLGRDRLLWAVAAINLVATAVTEREIVWLFVASGIVLLTARGGRVPRAVTALVPAWPLALAPLAPLAQGATLVQLAGFFAAAGTFVFGSGLAIVPFLHGGVVTSRGWLDERQFLDAVAVAMITPGPVVITVAFIGYLVAGLPGALVSAAAVFLPCGLIVLVLAPVYGRVAGNPGVRAFVGGVTAAASGVLAGAVVVLGRRAIHDLPTALIAAGALLALLRWRRLSEPLVILAAGGLGLLLRWPG